MIIVSKAKIRFLNAGRTIPIPDTSGRYKRGRDYAAGTHHHTTICRVEILEVTADTIHIRIAQLDPPRLLAARSEHGYTTDPMKAVPDEPEAISAAEAERISSDARARRQADLAEFRDDVLQRAAALATEASHADTRRLRNLARVASSLAVTHGTAVSC